jgi:hypothetical protein
MEQAMAQAIQTATTIPSAPPAPSILYIPEIHNRRGEVYFPELRTYDTSKHQIVADIASAQHDDVRRVIAVDVASGSSWDASKEIAGLVLDVVLQDEGRVPRWCVDFLEEHLGCNYVYRCEREAA